MVRPDLTKVAKQQRARAKERGPARLKELQESMEPLPKNRPRVLMEPDKQEYDYPETRKYNYVRPNSPKERIVPNDPQELGIPKRRLQNVAKRDTREYAKGGKVK